MFRLYSPNGVIPGRPEGPNLESMNTSLWNMDSGFAAEPVLGPREARTRGQCPGMTIPDT
jgi:hypothetical protein